jgi:hypothetical protein
VFICSDDSMETDGLQVGKTRDTHSSIAYHLVCVPKYRRRVLTGEARQEAKRLIAQCCERRGLKKLSLETDEDHNYRLCSRSLSTRRRIFPDGTLGSTSMNSTI